MSSIISGYLKIVRYLIWKDHLHVLYLTMLWYRWLRSLWLIWSRILQILGTSGRLVQYLIRYLFSRSPHPRLFLRPILATMLWALLDGWALLLEALIEAGGRSGGHLFSPSILGVELWTTWTGIIYMRLIFQLTAWWLRVTFLLLWVGFSLIPRKLPHILCCRYLYTVVGTASLADQHVYDEANYS